MCAYILNKKIQSIVIGRYWIIDWEMKAELARYHDSPLLLDNQEKLSFFGTNVSRYNL